jgi:RHS repeat-associated protein
LSIGEQYAFGMSMPGRTFSVEDYRYGFNGKENQDELLGEDNSQDFGARIYDARVGRWWGLDPCYYKFAYTTPYNFSLNNPLYYVDHDGLEPTVAGRIGLGDYIKYLNENDVTQLTALMNIHGGYFGTSILGKKGSQTTHRYLYSPKWGWIDMTHFAMGAALSSLNPVTPDMALRWLENHERDNKDPGSTFDYEDLVSNLLGVYFYEYLSEQKDNTKSLIENLDDYLTKLGFVDNPVRYAPNIIPEDHHGGVEPQNRTYNPSFTYKNSQNWYNGLDLKIVKFKNKFMEGKDQDRKYVTKGPKSSQSKPKGGTPKKNAEPKQKGSTPKKKAEPKRKSRPKF